MRVRRLCERKTGGKLNVPQEVHNDFVNGGSAREVLELSLLQAIQKFGTSRSVYKKVRVSCLKTQVYRYIYLTVILRNIIGVFDLSTLSFPIQPRNGMPA